MNPEQIIRLREALGFTQQQLANEIGAHQTTVARWETGVTKAQGANLKALKELAERVKSKKKSRK